MSTKKELSKADSTLAKNSSTPKQKANAAKKLGKEGGKS